MYNLGRAYSRARAKSIVHEIQPHLSTVDKVVDVGAGKCWVGRLLNESGAVEVTSVDVVDHNTSGETLRLYDGKKLPFEDGAFDVSLLIFVLHHAIDRA